MEPKTGVKFKFIAKAPIAGTSTEGYLCTSQIASEKMAKNIYETTMTGEFIEPSLHFSETLLSYKYI